LGYCTNRARHGHDNCRYTTSHYKTQRNDKRAGKRGKAFSIPLILCFTTSSTKANVELYPYRKQRFSDCDSVSQDTSCAPAKQRFPSPNSNADPSLLQQSHANEQAPLPTRSRRIHTAGPKARIQSRRCPRYHRSRPPRRWPLMP
jgi:hypothetical protein